MESTTLTGKETSTTLNDQELRKVNDLVSCGISKLTTSTVMSHSKVINHQIIQSHTMSRATRTNSYTVAYTYNSRVCYGKLISILGCKLALIKQLKVTEQPFFLDVHIRSTTTRGFYFCGGIRQTCCCRNSPKFNTYEML